MIDISFSQAGAFKGENGGPDVLTNPTSIQFGPDGRLYVSEQDGSINAFTVGQMSDGSYIATSHEELLLPNGDGVVKSLQNHNDDGSLDDNIKRQVTGILVTGTAAKPVLYISSSDPRISFDGDVNLDTNSGVITRVTWTGSAWEAVDLIRGLPRSEENHSNNGLVLSPDGSKLYVAVGSNTNNGAPSKLFAYTGEYALSGTVLEIDLKDIDSRPVLTDPVGGQGGKPRKYIYNLPTLDDPTVANDGLRENARGLDVAGPWGGNDGFNMAILPADAPLRIFADGFRNHYDLVMTDDGRLYTVDNGSNTNAGGDPVPDGNGNATNQPNEGGKGNPEPLFLIEEGGYYGHPNPARSNQTLAWTVYNDKGQFDGTLAPNNVASLADLVPNSLKIEEGYIIAPNKFTGNVDRLKQSGIRVQHSEPDQTNALVTLGSSSNGLVEYTGDAFEGALKGDLLVTQFNGNVGRLDLGSDGTAATYETVKGLSSFSNPLDVTTGPQGTLWVTELGTNQIKAFAPSTNTSGGNVDIDNDGINNVNDPFIRDDSNGGSVVLAPNQSLLWDFDANQDDNLPGPNGYGGGLTGVMIDGSTDFEAFFQEPSRLPGQNLKLDNVKFITAAGGGTTVIENVSNGSAHKGKNTGQYLFHTGVTIAPTVDEFTIQWSVLNPAMSTTGTYQQIGGYIGTGDQSNYLKLAAIQHPAGEVQLLLEDKDVIQSKRFYQANDLFTVPENSQIFLELTVNPSLGTAKPTIVYETAAGNKTVTGEAISLAGTSVLDAIRGNYKVSGNTTGLAVGLMASNVGEPSQNSFQAIFDDIKISSRETSPKPNPINSQALYRVNAGGEAIQAIDGGPEWSADTAGKKSAFLAVPGSNSVSKSAVFPGNSVANSTPGEIFQTERWDQGGGSEMQWAFAVEKGAYEVRLYMGNNWSDTKNPGQRVFDVALEGSVTSNLDDIDLASRFGHTVGGVISDTVQVSDGVLNIDFLHGVQNPLVNGIEILKAGSGQSAPLSAQAVQQSDPVRLEAEEADTILNYREESISAASGGQALSFFGGQQNEQGSATFEFDGLTGTYDVLAGTFDENDGIANFSAEHTDVETGVTTDIGSLQLNDDLGSPLANAQTALRQSIAQGIGLTTGDSITIHGFEQANEHARLDFIELVPTV